jgi:hypothetical protein
LVIHRRAECDGYLGVRVGRQRGEAGVLSARARATELPGQVRSQAPVEGGKLGNEGKAPAEGGKLGNEGI